MSSKIAGPILVTGGAGFIGSHVVDALLLRGLRVVALDNFDRFYDPAIKQRNIARHRDDRLFTLEAGDIRSRDALTRVFRHGPFGTVIHLAGRAGVRPSLRAPLLYEDVNVRGTIRLLERLHQHSSTHFILGSSSSVYGANTPVPFREAEPADRPSSPYAATKRAAELTCHSFHHLYGIPITCLRFFTAYGPRQRPDMAIHQFTRLITNGRPVTLFGDGGTMRDYTYVDDIVAGVLRSAQRPGGFRIYNLGTSDTTTLTDVVRTIGVHVGQEPIVRHRPDQPGDVPVTFADISLARMELGYDPQVPFATGVERFVEWFKNAGG